MQRGIVASRYKTSICKAHNKTGRCAHGDRCVFAHGEAELRTREANLRAGLRTPASLRVHRERGGSTGANTGSERQSNASSERPSTTASRRGSDSQPAVACNVDTPTTAPRAPQVTTSYPGSATCSSPRLRGAHNPYAAKVCPVPPQSAWASSDAASGYALH